MRAGDFPTIPHDNYILNIDYKQDGKHTHTYIYIYALYILHICTCTCILDVSKRGVLGSADDDIAFFLHILSILVIM